MKRRIHCWNAGIAVLVICAGGTLGHAVAQTQSELQALKERYQFATWLGKTKTNYAHAVTRWEPDWVSIGGTNVVARPWGRDGIAKIYSFSLASNSSVRLELRIVQCTDATNAQHAMMQYFLNCPALQPFQLGAELGVDVGDRCYICNPKRSSIVFVRNNLLVMLATVRGDASAIAIAEELDKQIELHKP